MKLKISKKLKELRAQNKKTQSQIAEVLGITRQAYSRYESSMREPSFDSLAKLAEYYDVSPQYFFTESVDTTTESEMDIVELSAIYQAKKVAQTKKTDETNDVDSNNENDLEEMKTMLVSKLGLQNKMVNTVQENDELPIYIKKRFTVKKVLFMLLILLAIFNISIMTIHKMDPNYEYKVFNHSYINAISPGQNVSNTMYTSIVRMVEFDSNSVSVGDTVVIYSDFGVDEYWVEEIVTINEDLQEVTVTYDNVSVQKIPFALVIGTYENDSSIFGTIYYSSKFNIGYLLLLAAHGFILTFIYYTFTGKKDGKR